MCPHCVVQDLTRLHSSDSVVLVARPQYGSWQNARLLANDGRFFRNGNRGSIRCYNFDKHSSKVKQLHRGTNDIVRYKETKWAVECAKAQVEAELSNAKQIVKDLFSMIGESMYKAKAEMRDIAPLKKYVKPRNDDNQYSQVMTELEHAKRELFQLKLHVGSVLEEKFEEKLVVQLDKMDALNELRDIEKLQNTRNKLKEAIEAIDEAKELEMKLATTLYDIDTLKNEFKFPTKEEIEAAKKDLASITKQGFKFMASIDVTRNQLKHVSAATIHLKNTKSKIGAKVRNLSYKLLRPKSKLEAVSAAEEKAKSIVSNLTQTLDKLKSKTKAAKKEKDLIINGEVSEERFQGAMQELQAVKSSEALTLEKLKILRENAMKDRISNNKLREQLVFDTLRGDWMVAFGIWEFDPLKLSNPFPDNRISAHIWQGYENKYHEVPHGGHLIVHYSGLCDEGEKEIPRLMSSVINLSYNALSTAKQQQLSMRNLQCASSTPTIFTARAPQGSRVTAFWGEVECLGFQLGHSGVDCLGFENVRNYIQGAHARDENINQNTKTVYSATRRCLV
ncbi:Protein PLASTID MOVEMENT IMPAIRED 2 [Glycine soja]